MGFFSKIKEGLKKTRNAVVNQIDGMLKSFTKIDEELFEELEELLVMGDVGVKTASKITDELRVRVKKEGVTDPNEVHRLLEEITADMLRGGEELNLNTKPSIILVIGVNGVGKTTTIGKLANNLRMQGKSVLLAAADTFRAAAIDQLEIWAERAQCDIVKQKEGSDPAAVVYDAISAAKARGTDVIIADTAGRLHNKKYLMDELGKITRIIDRELPDADKEFLIVLDATTGQNAVNQAREFKNSAGITGIVLTKLDGTAKGGVVLSVKEELGVPVKYIGVGEQMDDLQPFDADSFAKALFAKNEE
ncbi:signal recognition particle-docking protein FtsY [Oscillospiraceae bacterium LCP25S3_E10]|nr:signal recognition particle-docking protein FtsY [Ruminococcus sp.]MDD6446973.1 signal recognition particle-docking protein FtsY [Ruminococcus sp.]